MSTSPPPANVTDMDVDKHSPVDKHSVVDKPDAKVIIITNLTRNVVEAHLKTVFGFYGEIIKTDLPLFGKSGQNRGKAALEYADPPSAHKAASHMDGGQLDGAILQVSLSDLPVRSRSRSPRRLPPPRNARDRLRSISRSRSRTRSRSPPAYRRRPDGYPPRDSFRGRGFGRRGGPPGRDRDMYNKRGRSRSRSRSRSPVRRIAGERPPLPRRRSPSYSRGGYGRARRSRSRSYSVRSSRSRTRSLSRSRSRSGSYSSYSRYSRSRSRSRSVSRARRSYSRDDIRDSRSRSPKDTKES